MEDFLDIRSSPKLSSALLLTAAFVHVIGYSSTHWSDGGVFYTGLWKTCILTPTFHCLEDAYTAAVLFHLIGFSTAYWTNRSSYVYSNHWGLWKSCRIYCSSMGTKSGWFGATQAFETIGLIAGFVGLILTILYIFVTQTAGNRVLFIIDLLAVGIAAGSTLLGVIIYGANASALSWSFALAVIAGLVYGVAGALMVIHLLKPNLVQG
ncbi:uncharacterized protein LOC125647783 isoform X1 [Ostrea edulis]|uniref:uncharacterized protein LOC125647783 isoform X1 n=1 Tax=Ostrea edulis TaxID=37623 RepID=UPI0024AF98C7|nr:uncharacterized protein LOC125647783 isoform X1 [Ostrea edulis]